MQREQQLVTLILISALLFISCGGNGPGKRNPEINRIQPDSGPPGTSVKISGSGFSPVPEKNTVTFGGITAQVSGATESELQTTVPDSAETGPVEVTVDGNSVSGPQFTVEKKAPGIKSVEPDSGTVGTEVNIKGMNFSSTKSENTITFDGTAASIIRAAKDQLVTEVPENATDGPIEVTVLEKSTTGPEFDVLGPKITAVEPDTGVSGSAVIIKGKYFSETASENSISFGGIEAEVLKASEDSIKTKVPETATEGPIRLSVGEQPPSIADFTIVQSPQSCYGTDVALDAQQQWINSALTTSNDDNIRGMDMDAEGNVYMIQRDQGIVGKFNARGEIIWEKDLEADLPSTVWKGIETDGENLYIVGRRALSGGHLGIAQLDYHFSTLNDGNAAAGNADIVLAKLSVASGDIAWAQQIGSPDSDNLSSETVDILPSGNILVAVQMSGPFMPANSEPNSPPSDVGIAKFKKDGTLQTVKQLKAYRWPYSLSTDTEGGVYLGIKDNNDNTVFAKFSSDLMQQTSSKRVTNQIKPPIPMPDGGAVVYGNTGTPVEENVNVFINDAYVQRLGPGGGEKWVHQQKFSKNGSTKFTGGTALPGGGIGLTAQNASEIGGEPYIAFYTNEGRTLLIDESSFFELNEGGGSGWPVTMEAYRASDGSVRLIASGMTTGDWVPDDSRTSGGKDLWMTGMELKCKQQ